MLDKNLFHFCLLALSVKYNIVRLCGYFNLTSLLCNILEQ